MKNFDLKKLIGGAVVGALAGALAGGAIMALVSKLVSKNNTDEGYETYDSVEVTDYEDVE